MECLLFTFLYGWLYSHFEWIFVLYISVRMTTFSFWMDFRHIHFCTDDYPFLLNGFSSCTCLYEWLSISLWMGFRHVYFCTDDYQVILNGLLSWTFLYEWLPSHFEWIVVMHISVRMTTISFWIDCRHRSSGRRALSKWCHLSKKTKKTIHGKKMDRNKISCLGKYRVTVFIVLNFVKRFVWYRSVFTQYSYYNDFFSLGTALDPRYHHCRGWLKYIDTTKITVWCMSLLLLSIDLQ